MFELRLPGSNPAIVLGGNGSGKSLCTAAIQLVLGVTSEREMLRADLLTAGIDRIEIEFVVSGRVGRLQTFLQTGEQSVGWSDDDGHQNGSHASSEWVLHDLNKRLADTEQRSASALLAQANFVRNGELPVQVTKELLSALRRAALQPVESELQDWVRRLYALSGEQESGGRLVQERELLQKSQERIRYIGDLQTKLEQAHQFQADLQVRLVQLMSQLSVVNAEYDECTKIASVADRAQRIAVWLDEIHRECEDVADLREQHARSQEQLDVLENTFRGAPENLEDLLSEYRERLEAEAVLERKNAAALTEIQRMDEAIRAAKQELDDCKPPEPGVFQSEHRALQGELENLEARISSLLRERIDLIRERDGLQIRLQRDFAALRELDTAARESLISYLEWKNQAAERLAHRAQTHAEQQDRREREIKNLREQLYSDFAHFDELPGNAAELLRELHDRRKVVATLKSDREEFARRKENLEKRNNSGRKAAWIAVAAAIGAGVGAVAGGWDFALFAGLVASGLALLVLRFVYGRADRELESAVKAAELVTARLAENEESIIRLEAALPPLASLANPQEAADKLQEYCSTRERLGELTSSPVPNASEPDEEEQRSLDRFSERLPKHVFDIPVNTLEHQLGEFSVLQAALSQLDAQWREFEDDGSKQREIAAAERQVAEIRDKLQSAAASYDELMRNYESRRRESMERLTVLESVRAVELPPDQREAELAEVRERLTQLRDESAGFLGQMDADEMSEQLRTLGALRRDIRKIRDLLSAKQSLDELRAREGLLAEELETVKQKLTEMDPLYLLDGTVSDYAAKYSRQLVAAGDAMKMTEAAIDGLRRDLETVEVEHWSGLLTQCEPLHELQQTALQHEEAVQRTEHEAQVARETIAHLRSEHEVIERTFDDEFYRTMANQLRMLTDDRCRAVHVADDRLFVEFADGSQRALTSLSGGLSDVAWIAARLALLETLSDPIRFPVFWDEPFARLDDHHLARVRSALARCSEKQQVVLLTRDSRLTAWGDVVNLSDALVSESSPMQA